MQLITFFSARELCEFDPMAKLHKRRFGTCAFSAYYGYWAALPLKWLCAVSVGVVFPYQQRLLRVICHKLKQQSLKTISFFPKYFY